jgi:hypothetical protein
VDCYHILDTGSTDGTARVIGEHMRGLRHVSCVGNNGTKEQRVCEQGLIFKSSDQTFSGRFSATIVLRLKQM